MLSGKIDTRLGIFIDLSDYRRSQLWSVRIEGLTSLILLCPKFRYMVSELHLPTSGMAKMEKHFAINRACPEV